MTAKQRRFADEYLVDHNASQAAIRAGYAASGAGTSGHRLLKNDQIAQYIAKKDAEVSQKLQATREDVLIQLRNLGFSDIREIAKYANNLSQMPDEAAAAVKDIKFGETEDGDAYVAEIKLVDKVKPLELLGKHLGLFEGDQADTSIHIHLSNEDLSIL